MYISLLIIGYIFGGFFDIMLLLAVKILSEVDHASNMMLAKLIDKFNIGNFISDVALIPPPKDRPVAFPYSKGRRFIWNLHFLI